MKLSIAWSTLLLCTASKVAGHGHMSRHLAISDLSMVVVMADAPTTQGPYDEDEEDYVLTSDMTAAATAGSPGLAEDREKVLAGIPLNLTLTVYDLSNAGDGYANEYEDVEVFLWHTDTSGVYSAVEEARQSAEGTDGQVWLRAHQFTDAAGQVTFQTILPGWYTDRALHYHVRLRFNGSDTWAATSQFLFNDTARSLYETVEPYVSNTNTKVDLETDSIYTALDDDVADLLTLKLHGSLETGFVSSVLLGLLPSDVWESTDEENEAGDNGQDYNGNFTGGDFQDGNFTRPDDPDGNRTRPDDEFGNWTNPGGPGSNDTATEDEAITGTTSGPTASPTANLTLAPTTIESSSSGAVHFGVSSCLVVVLIGVVMF